MIAKIFWLDSTEKVAWLHVWIDGKYGPKTQTEVYLNLVDLAHYGSIYDKIREGDEIEFELGFKNGKYIAENPIWCVK